ncbi:MAG: hypothetical protein OER85_17265 [Gammaproteobacteria bacterium]|nr:hypothetical protein [Gammaproteobacteria bacterium]
MKLFRFLKGRKAKRPLSPIRTVQSPGAARADRLAREARAAQAAKNAATRHEIRTTPKPEDIDPIFADTGSLELSRDRGAGADNPYDTATWRHDPDEGLRRVDDTKAIRNKADRTPRKSKDKTNPYDTIVGRKGW